MLFSRLINLGDKMSRTKRKYPTYKYVRHGVFYDNIKDIPEPENSLLIKEEIKESYYEWISSPRCRYDKENNPIPGTDYVRFIPIKKYRWVETGRMIPSRWNRGNYTLVGFYNSKVCEGWNHNNRMWQTEGVGKINKRLREKKFRSKNRKATYQCLSGYVDETTFPINIKGDRWDYY